MPYRRTITIDSTKVGSGGVTNFPVLISGTYPYLKTVENKGLVTNSNGYDIWFTSDESGATRLSHELESYSATTGTLSVWVKVPSISSTANTIIYLWYNDSSVTQPSSVASSVWDSNYKGVWHLGGNPLSALDSTINAKNGVVTGATTSTGKISNGANYNGGTDKINVGTGITTQVFSVSGWVNPTSFAVERRLWGGGQSDMTSYIDLTGKIQVDSNNNIAIGTSTTALVAGVWSHVVFTYDVSGNWKHYINGAAAGSGTNLVTLTTSTTLYLGNDSLSNNLAMLGVMDEIRYSNTSRSAAWVLTEYNNQNNPSTFYSVEIITASFSNILTVSNLNSITI